MVVAHTAAVSGDAARRTGWPLRGWSSLDARDTGRDAMSEMRWGEQMKGDIPEREHDEPENGRSLHESETRRSTRPTHHQFLTVADT